MSNFRERLRLQRIKTGETQQQVGDAIGVSRMSITKYEAGTSEPDLGVVGKIARHFKVPIEYILGSTDEDFAIILTNPEFKKYESHLYDPKFVAYIDLAAQIMDNNIELADVSSFVNNLIKYRKQGRKENKDE